MCAANLSGLGVEAGPMAGAMARGRGGGRWVDGGSVPLIGPPVGRSVGRSGSVGKSVSVGMGGGKGLLRTVDNSVLGPTVNNNRRTLSA